MKFFTVSSLFLLAIVVTAPTLMVSCEGDETDNDAAESPTMQDDGLSAVSDEAGAAAPAAPTSDEDNTEPGTEPETVDRANVLDSLARLVFKPSLDAFVIKTTQLDDAVGTWSATPSTENLEAAQNAWRETMTAWQYLEVMQVGAAGNTRFRVGGEGVRDNIYSFPVTNPCKVDQQLASESYEDPDWATSGLVNSKGLDALEFLLFRNDLDNECPDAARINRENTWSDLMANMPELEDRRGALAAVLSNQVEVQAVVLADHWSSEGGQFTEALATGSAPYESTREALDQVFAAFFYIDKVIKDLKLARPAAISPECTEDVCPQFVEHRFARFGKEALIANLEAIKLIFLGADEDGGLGFADLLILEGAPELAEGMTTKLDAALDAVNAIEGDLGSALVSDANQVVLAHGAVKSFTDDMKSQMVTVLGLRVPQEGAGDND